MSKERDPRSDPQPGDRVSVGGTIRCVLAVDRCPPCPACNGADHSRVSWEVEGMCNELHSCTLPHWRRSMRRVKALKPRSLTKRQLGSPP